MTTVAPAATPPHLDAVPFARGYVAGVKTQAAWPYSFGHRFVNRLLRPRATLYAGWMLMPDGPFDEIEAYVDGRPYGRNEPTARPDLVHAFPHIPDAGRAGFSFLIPARVARRGRLTLVGRRDGRPLGKMQMRFRDDLFRVVPQPPPHLTKRVTGTVRPDFFLIQGYKSFDEIRDALLRHRPLTEIRRLLDWGCGCGRLTAHSLRRRDGVEVHGCDIDPEAIEWCRTNLPRGRFATVPFAPPTPYPDGHFDAIYGYSVFTHLTCAAQHQWLAEMRRILAPGGVFVATVQGPSAAWFVFGDRADGMLAGGIHDGTHDPGMESVVGDGAYRSTYQTPDWTRETFGRYFEVLEYAERAIGNNQDLVVLRRR